MKIGILTFHRAHNYGAALQAYSMKMIFSRYGAAELIDYWPDYHKYDYALMDLRCFDINITLKQRIKFIKSFIKRIILIPLRLKRHNKFKNFINQYLLDDNVHSTVTVSASSGLPQEFDYYVYGSDQIWRVYDFAHYPVPDLVYLGGCIPSTSKRIAYAASMGAINNDTLANHEVRESLGKFVSLGVRELDLKKALEDINLKRVEHVLDPTFLVDVDVWRGISETSTIFNKKPYILFYSLIESSASKKIVQTISNELGLDIIEINGFETINGLFSPQLVQTAGPIDFLHLINNAEFVVSTSFHGVVFSILFNKQFYACGMGGHSGRVASLLDLLGIKDRLIDNADEVMITEKINYDGVEEKLRYQVKLSNEFIQSSLSFGG